MHGTYVLFAAEIISGTVNPNLSSILFPNSAGIDQDKLVNLLVMNTISP
jgi:hypothetical protein